MNCLLVMKIKWSLDINTGAVERSEAARARRLAGATVVGDDVIASTVVGDDVIASTGYMKKQPGIWLHLTQGCLPGCPRPEIWLAPLPHPHSLRVRSQVHYRPLSLLSKRWISHFET